MKNMMFSCLILLNMSSLAQESGGEDNDAIYTSLTWIKDLRRSWEDSILPTMINENSTSFQIKIAIQGFAHATNQTTAALVYDVDNGLITPFEYSERMLTVNTIASQVEFVQNGLASGLEFMEGLTSPYRNTYLELKAFDFMKTMISREPIDGDYSFQDRHLDEVMVNTRIVQHPEWMRHPDPDIKANQANAALALAHYYDRVENDYSQAADYYALYLTKVRNNNCNRSGGMHVTVAEYRATLTHLPARSSLASDYETWAASSSQALLDGTMVLDPPGLGDGIRIYQEEMSALIQLNLAEAATGKK